MPLENGLLNPGRAAVINDACVSHWKCGGGEGDYQVFNMGRTGHRHFHLLMDVYFMLGSQAKSFGSVLSFLPSV